MSQRILFVDDEAEILHAYGKLLARRGYKTTGTLKAREALAICRDEPFDLVLLDIALADADGLEVLDLFKSEHPNLPVIMFTGLGYDDELVEEALERGADGYVIKGQPPSQLIMEIHRVLGRR